MGCNKILTSQDNELWDTIFCECTGDGEEDVIYFTGNEAKYVQMLGESRSNIHAGYSIYEIEIYQSDSNTYDSHCGSPCNPDAIDDEFIKSVSMHPNPMDEEVTFSFNLRNGADIRLALYDVTGKRTAEIFEGYRNAGFQAITWKKGHLSSGIYFYNIMIYSNDQAQNLTGESLITD